MRRNLFWLSDEQWKRIEPRLPTDVRGVERTDDRRVISGIVHVLRPGIKFHDGSPLTAHDVAFSLKILKEKGHPIAQQLLRDFVGAEAPDDAIVVVRFVAHRARDVPLFVAALPIFSRSFYAARRFDETTLEVPLGTAPIRQSQRLSLGVSVGCGEARRVVHQFEFLAAVVAVAAVSTAVRHVSPVPHSPRQSEAPYALNLGRSFGRRPCGPLRHARANASGR